MAAQYQTDFLREWTPEASGVSALLGIPVSWVLGQWALETGWGRYLEGVNNPGNIKGNSPVAYSYASPEAGAQAYYKTLTNVRYAEALTATSAEGFSRGLASRYAPLDPAYAKNLAATIGSVEAIGVPGVGLDPRAAGGAAPGEETPAGSVMRKIGEFVKASGINIAFVAFGGLALAGVVWYSVAPQAGIAKTAMKMIGKK
jgi:hypothetical protein